MSLKIWLMYMYKNDLALNNVQWLVCQKNKPNQTKLFVQVVIKFSSIYEWFRWHCPLHPIKERNGEHSLFYRGITKHQTPSIVLRKFINFLARTATYRADQIWYFQ